MPDGRVCPDAFRGYLWKWTNYIKGYQKRWCVLFNGLLSYYRSPAEMNHTCRGTINLAGAFIDTVDSCSFVINGGSQVWHLRAGSEIERQRWVTALELAKAKAIKNLASDDDSDSDTDTDEATTRSLNSKLDDLVTCNNLVSSQGGLLQRLISDLVDAAAASSVPLPSLAGASPGGAILFPPTSGTTAATAEVETSGSTDEKLKLINEKAQLFRITANAMVNTCSEFVSVAGAYERKQSKLISLERGKRMRLEETVETLAKQHIQLEQACEIEKQVSNAQHQKGYDSPTIKGGSDPFAAGVSEHVRTLGDSEDEEDNDEFFDAIAEHPEAFPGFDLSASRRVESAVDIYGNFHDDDEGGESATGGGADDAEDQFEEDQRGERLGADGKLASTSTLVRCSSENALKRDHDSSGHRRVKSYDVRGKSTESVFLSSTQTSTSTLNKAGSRVYRTKIPYKPNSNISLWSIMKNCIGKELTKIPMPVNFSEPLSMTQRLTDELEYASLLDKAAACESSLEQICYIAAFSISAYATTAVRTGKPFNPMLGETYECDRWSNSGWTSLAEQVSHHPPSLAQHVQGKDWTFWQNFTMSSKFRGKYLMVAPIGTSHCKFGKSGNHYTWKKVTTTVHNIIVGKLWIDQSGEMDIINHTTGEKCHLKYHAYSYFSKELPKRVTGFVADANKVTRYVLSGFWDQKVECAKVIYKEPGHNVPGKTPQGIPTSKSGNPQTLPPQLLWSKTPLPYDASKMYNFGEFSCSLNEMEEGLPPTDSRFRPDLRLMEDQDFEEANRIKMVLEESQRARRRERELEAEAAVDTGRVFVGYLPTWFELTDDESTDLPIYTYKGGYWEAKERGDWSNCPDIY